MAIRLKNMTSTFPVRPRYSQFACKDFAHLDNVPLDAPPVDHVDAIADSIYTRLPSALLP